MHSTVMPAVNLVGHNGDGHGKIRCECNSGTNVVEEPTTFCLDLRSTLQEETYIRYSGLKFMMERSQGPGWGNLAKYIQYQTVSKYLSLYS